MVGSRASNGWRQGSRVDACCKRIARLICSRQLVPGDRLPPQEELRTMLGASNDTLSAAMAKLVEIGLLSRKTRVGTIVVDLSAMDQIIWSVGLATFAAADHGPSAFFSDLHHRFLVALHRTNCDCTTYLRGFGEYPCHKMSNFAGLEQDVEAGHLDGLLTLMNLAPEDWQCIESKNVPVCYTGTWSGAPTGVLIDLPSFEREALSILETRGCRRVTLAGCSMDDISNATGFAEAFYVVPGISGGQLAAMSILERPIDQRPDGIVLEDDYSAMGLTSVFAEAGDYRPRTVVMTNKQLPLVFALPIIRFDLESDMLVERAVKMFKSSVLGHPLAGRIEKVAPVLVDGVERHAPAVAECLAVTA